MKKIFAIAFFIFIAQITVRGQEQEKEYKIAGITTSGLRFLDQTAIINLSGLKVGDVIHIPGNELNAATKKLWKTGLVGDIKISATKFEESNVFLDIFLDERPRVSRFVFEGIKKGKKATLEDKIKDNKGKLASDILIKNVKNAIYKYYAEKGYGNTTVEITQVRDSLVRNAAVLKINVNPQSKIKVRKIYIEGVTKVSEKKILKKMKTKRAGKTIFGSSKFKKDRIEEDKEKIIKYYNMLGYRDAQIVSDTSYLVSPSRRNLRIKIDEGNQYFYRTITWEGNVKYTDEQLASILGIKKGDIYNQEALDRKLSFSLNEQDITSLYMDDGYLFFRVMPIEKKVEGDSIDIEMRMYEGSQATIDKIIINGNTKTSDHVILREIRTVPGQKFSRRNLIRTQQALASLQYFVPDKIGINPIPHPENGTVDVQYDLEEKASDQLELSGGWGAGFGFIGTLGVKFTNFSMRKAGKWANWRPVPVGDGQQLALRIQANGRAFQTYSLTFSEPWLGGKRPNSFTFNTSFSQQRGFSGTAQVNGLNILGMGISLGRRLRKPDDYFTLSHTLSFNSYKLNNYAIIQGFSNGNSNNINLNTTLSRNSVDSPIFPRNGSTLSLSVALTPPYSLFSPEKDYKTLELSEKFKWLEYHKWMFDASFFSPIGKKFVLNTRAHLGFLNSYNPSLGVVPFERFVLGGAGLAGQNFLLGTDNIALRGYNDQSVVPFDSQFSSSRTVGGTTYVKYVMELRYPVSTSQAATIFVLGFVEGGNNWSSLKEFNPFDLYRSVGVGARIFMPAFGLIGLDYGIGFDKVPGRPSANGGQFHFTIGQQIR